MYPTNPLCFGIGTITSASTARQLPHVLYRRRDIHTRPSADLCIALGRMGNISLAGRRRYQHYGYVGHHGRCSLGWGVLRELGWIQAVIDDGLYREPD